VIFQNMPFFRKHFTLLSFS